MRLRFLIATVLSVVGLAACNSIDSTETPVKVNPLVPIEETTFAPALGVNLAASTKTADGLYYRDIVVGTGTLITSNHTVGVYYAGQFASGTQFDARQSPATPFSFLLGAGGVIKGWDEGVVGMRVGGKRQLIVPPALGYGPIDYQGIPGNSVLVFTVEAISVQ